MPASAWRCAARVALAFNLAYPSPAQAQTPAGTEELSPPELVRAPPIVYPEAARSTQLDAVVVLRLTIDREGRVVDSEVEEPAGHGLDEEARQASFGLRFQPARRNGAPIQARIRYAVKFEFEDPQEPPAPAPAPAPPAPAPPAPAPPAPAPHRGEPRTVDVRVRARRSAIERLQQSAEAVNVVDTRRAKRETADLGEVLARTQGISIRRDGGLGSTSRFSLNGLTDDQIRFFVDGVPLELAGFPFSIENVPVNLAERVEIYRGVVPIRFGADALGGAVNLVTDQLFRTKAAASYQTGSFGLHRVTARGSYQHPESGFVLALTSFADLTKNNYEIDVEVPDDRGRLSPATVRRFHDAYQGYGVMLETGVVDRPWAKRLTLKGFYAGYHKELQHNLVMSVPYGEVDYGERVSGVTARYDVDLFHDLRLGLVASYSRRTIDFDDHSRWVYDWYGRRIRERRVRGERDSDPNDQTERENTGFARASLEWTLAPEHAIRASLASSLAVRTGEERLRATPTARDALAADRRLLNAVTGVEYELGALDERLANIVFVKDYVYDASTEEPLPGNLWVERDRQEHRLGFGDSLRFHFTPCLMFKASYEFATRLPRTDEVFGDGILVKQNLDLSPELSHNANLGPRVELRHPRLGSVVVDVNGFYRDSEQLIVLLGTDRDYQYQNIYRARSLGLENAASWQSPDGMLAVEGTLTWQEVRNASSRGTFGDFTGDRIPNRPYLFGSFGGRLRFEGVPERDDTLEPFYHGRYVHWFFRGWESVGQRDLKQVTDSQLTHDAGLTYSVNRAAARVHATLEVMNLTDARVYDNYGVQRPGRAVYLKVTGEI